MPKKPNKQTSFIPFSLRFSFEERAQLEKDAGDMPLGKYIRTQLFQNPTPRIRKRKRRPVKDERILIQLLDAIGASRIASNLNQIAKAVNSGSLIVSPEVESVIRAACRDIDFMRRAIIRGLGLSPEDKNDP